MMLVGFPGARTLDLFGTSLVNPATLRSIASITGGQFFRANDYESFDHGFQTVRNNLGWTRPSALATERVPDKQLFIPLATLAMILVGFEVLLAYGRLRRLP